MLAFLLAGCATAAPVTPPSSAPEAEPAAVMLAYPSAMPAPVQYEMSDTTRSRIEAGPVGVIDVVLANRSLSRLEFAAAGDSTRVTITMTEFSGTFSNSAAPAPVTASITDITSPAVVTLTPRGASTLSQRPQVTQQFRQVAGSDAVFRRFFMRLPARAVRPGAMWTDTVTSEETTDGLNSRTSDVIRSTYLRDTTVAGQRMALISTTSQRSVDVNGSSQGVDIVQKLAGTASGTALWDISRRLLVSRNESVDMRGTFDLPGMNLTGMPITATAILRVQLRP